MNNQNLILKVDFRLCFVKILVNPQGLTAFYVSHRQKSIALKFCDPKRAEFCVIFGAKEFVRLTPTNDDKPKSAEIILFWAGLDYSRSLKQ